MTDINKQLRDGFPTAKETEKFVEKFRPTYSGRKDDEEKPRLHLIPPETIESLGDVLTFGAQKYEERNWEHGMNWSRVFSALMRHMWYWWKGDEKDPETGYSHLDHALCCIVFLVTYEKRGVGTDDRPT